MGSRIGNHHRKSVFPYGSMFHVPANKVTVSNQTNYFGNMIYENGALSKILFDDDYIRMSGSTPAYHYYIQDHQENNHE